MLPSIRETLSHYMPKPLEQQQQYAVLLPLIKTAHSYEILFQVRANHISQPGEVSFPGGKVERGESNRQAALRETMEELQLPENAIDIIGEIDYLVQGTRSIYCFVGIIHVASIEDITPNEEVSKLFTLPIDYFIQHPPTMYRLTTDLHFPRTFPFERIPNQTNYPFQPLSHTVPFYESYTTHTIWGMTARFTKRFIDIIVEK